MTQENKVQNSHNWWIATAVTEMEAIRRRWCFTSFRQFSMALCMDPRTVGKLNPNRPDGTLELESLDRIYNTLIRLLPEHFHPEEQEEEYRFLVESRIRILRCAPVRENEHLHL